MVDTAALLVDEVLPSVPIRQWVLSVPFPLRFMFAPNSRYRAHITLARRGRRPKADSNQPESELRQTMIWAQRLKRLFRIDIDKSAGQPICTVADCREAVGHRDVPDEICDHWGGAVRTIASIEDPGVIEKILTHIERRDAASPQAARAAGFLPGRFAVAPIDPALSGAGDGNATTPFVHRDRNGGLSRTSGRK